MKNWFYIPFLLFSAIVYTRVSMNLALQREVISRGPASVVIESAEPETVCENHAQKFNPRYLAKECL